MKEHFKKIILQSTNSESLFEIDKIQDLWSGYGAIKRYGLKNSKINSVVVKHVCLPEGSTHPRGWNTDLSHNRKLKSYQVETAWYHHWSKYCDENC